MWACRGSFTFSEAALPCFWKNLFIPRELAVLPPQGWRGEAMTLLRSPGTGKMFVGNPEFLNWCKQGWGDESPARWWPVGTCSVTSVTLSPLSPPSPATLPACLCSSGRMWPHKWALVNSEQFLKPWSCTGTVARPWSGSPGMWWGHHPWKCSKTSWILDVALCDGILWFWRLDWTILEVFSSFNDSVILCPPAPLGSLSLATEGWLLW